MGTEFWDQVASDTASLMGGSEVSIPFLIIDGEGEYEASGIFEHSYRELTGDGPIPIPSRYAAIRIYEAAMPVRIRTGMQLRIREKAYQVLNIREPGLDGITTLELQL
jgi:hypothetical protein